MELLDYTEKSFVVIGDTKNIKDKLKDLGGRYNPNLTHPETKEKLAAWVFSKKQKEKIQTFLKNGDSTVDPVDSIVDPIQRLGLRDNGADLTKNVRKKRVSSNKETSSQIIRKTDVTLENEVQEVPEFQEISSFTMIVPKVGMKVKLKNEENEELILCIKETKKNKDGYILEFRAVDLNNDSIVIDFVMVGREWRRMNTDVPHWMNFI